MMNTTRKEQSLPRNTSTTAGSRVYEYVKDNLLEDAYRNLERIPIEKIAKELGVSRQPVMDAIKRLSAEGFIEIIPQVGSRLRQYSSRDVLDFFNFLR
ncbi:MAG: GntR family transcriptional regulator [Kordiimonadaceae bacterium]|nr:GntR family transcriptional regulator [Kordiimonadaceae bacterium]